MLRYKSKMSRKKAMEKICVHAIFGPHSMQPRPNTEDEVRSYFLARQTTLDRVAEECRAYQRPIPDFESATISGWRVFSSGGTRVSSLDPQGQERAYVEGAGELTIVQYLALFEKACEARDRTVERASYLDFQQAIVCGVASIEGFVNAVVEAWNARHPHDPLRDSAHQRVSLNVKLKEWIPKIRGGAKLDRSSHHWHDFATLSKIRHELTIHPKMSAYGASEIELARKVNLFRSGLAFILGALHISVGSPVPAVVINAVYMPDVEVV